MKTFCAAAAALFPIPTSKKLASILLIATATAAQAGLVVNESFVGYTWDANLPGQAATGTGLTGNWGGSQFFKPVSTGLSMTGVYSTGGSVRFNAGTDTNAKTAFAAFSTPMSSDTTYYGSYLFSYTSAGTQGRTVGGIGIGASGDNDNAASFVWAGNGYNSTTTIEGPNIRAESTGTPVPTFSLTSDTTYIMLFEFNGANGTTSAWVLNQAQLNNFSSSLNATTLNAAETNTNSATGTTWSGSVDGTAATSMDNLLFFGLRSTDATFRYNMDEIRFSSTNLLESVTAVPEPSTVAAGFALGALVLGRAIRRRRNNA